MSKLNRLKEVGKAFAKQSKRNSMKVAAGIALMGALSSCDSQPMTGRLFHSAASDYKEGKTAELLDENKQALTQHIAVYNEYFDTYEKKQKTLSNLHADGDLAGYKKEKLRADELKATIVKLEDLIDDLLDEREDLLKYYGRGKANAKADAKPQPQPQKEVFKRRTFQEFRP